MKYVFEFKSKSIFCEIVNSSEMGTISKCDVFVPVYDDSGKVIDRHKAHTFFKPFDQKLSSDLIQYFKNIISENGLGDFKELLNIYTQ